MKLPLYTIEGEKKGMVEVPEEVFGVHAHPDLTWQAVVTAGANKRRSYAHTKDRGEVRGGGKKPWKQKGTGRARHGSRRSPLWVGGGVTFGPRNERIFGKSINKKMQVKALLGVLSQKAIGGDMYIVETLAVPEAKTKGAQKFLTGVFAEVRKNDDKRGKRVVLVGSLKDKEFGLAFRNILSATPRRIENMSILDATNHRYIVFSQSALEEFVTKMSNKVKTKNG
jgi:large subunit ribosomal protein L4